jgi:predicted hydrocarbon binding protein
LRTALFYSCKGGGGRTLALANVASLLTRLGHNVLCVDLDLEAPGLLEALSPPEGRKGDGAGGFLHYALGWLKERRTVEALWTEAEGEGPDAAEARAKAQEAEVEAQEAARASLSKAEILWDSWGGCKLRLIKAGNPLSAAGYSDYAGVLRGGYLESIYAPPPSEHSGADRTEDEERVSRRYAAFWRDLNYGLEGIEAAYLLIDTRTGFSPLAATTVGAFLDGDGLARPAESLDIFAFAERGSRASRLGTQVFMRELYERYESSNPRPHVTIVRREETLAKGPNEPEARGKERQEWLVEGESDRRWTNLIDAYLGLRTDPKVERTGVNLASLHGELTPSGLLDDYVELAAMLVPELSLAEVRERLGLAKPRVGMDYKLFEVPDDGGMINIADAQPNISFTVNTFHLLVRVLLDARSENDQRLVDVAQKAGETFAENLLETNHDDRQAAIQDWLKIDSSVGWGLFALTPSHIGEFERKLEEDKRPYVTVANNLGFAPAGLCSFLGGYIAGILSKLVGKAVAADLEHHDECHSKDYERCKFVFDAARSVDER